VSGPPGTAGTLLVLTAASSWTIKIYQPIIATTKSIELLYCQLPKRFWWKLERW
jgi:hypothetical protein